MSLTTSPPLFAEVPDTVSFKKIRKRIVRSTFNTIETFNMIKSAGVSKPRWLVCLSGGKDSYGLLSALLDLQWQGGLPVELLACNLDQGQPGFPKDVLPNWLDSTGVKYRIVTEDTYSIVTEKIPNSKTYCSLCSRLRRGILYSVAREEGCNAIVLGHHRDDALETLMLNLLYGGRLASMPPKLLNDAGDIFVLRPLIGVDEDDLQKFADAMKFPIIPCDLCGSQEGLKRQTMKMMLSEWERKKPGTKKIMARALSSVRNSHLHDPKTFDFVDLAPQETELDLVL